VISEAARISIRSCLKQADGVRRERERERERERGRGRGRRERRDAAGESERSALIANTCKTRPMQSI